MCPEKKKHKGEHDFEDKEGIRRAIPRDRKGELVCQDCKTMVMTVPQTQRLRGCWLHLRALDPNDRMKKREEAGDKPIEETMLAEKLGISEVTRVGRGIMTRGTSISGWHSVNSWDFRTTWRL